MTIHAKGPPRGESAGGPEVVFLEENASNVGPNANSAQGKFRNPRAVAAVIKDLNGEYASEAAHIASVYARHFVEDMEIGDVWSAEHDMRHSASPGSHRKVPRVARQTAPGSGGRAVTGAPFPRHSHLRLVPPAPPPRRPLTVRINVLDGRSAFGRYAFRLSHDELDELIAVVMRMERRA
jgi:hypothetical protein